MSLNQIKPYQSLVLAEIKENINPSPVINSVLNEVEKILDFDEGRKRIYRYSPRGSGELIVGYLHYKDIKTPGWTSSFNIKDEINQLVLICRKDRYIALFISDGSLKSRIIREIWLDQFPGFKALDLIPQGIMNAAFVEGEAKTLWLSGTHRRVAVKADNKVLTGVDLTDALDPLGDQTYHFTAARCNPKVGEETLLMGVAPRKSSIWSGLSKQWIDFRYTVTTIFDHLEKINNPEERPVPVLATSAIEIKEIEKPFEIGIISPELLSDASELDDKEREELERWAYKTVFTDFKMTNFDPLQFMFIFNVILEGELLGKAEMKLNFSNLDYIVWTVDGIDGMVYNQDEFNRACQLMRKRTWLKIWFESGHTLCDGALFELQHRDIPFGGYVWGDFTGHEVSKEKPNKLELDGNNFALEPGEEKSLFDWMVRYWPNLNQGNTHSGGWLACDDRSMETADFIHLDVEETPPLLSLIHVKGAGSSKPNRKISVSNYEVVTGQAVKNLRHMDRILLSEELEEGIDKKVGKFVWFNRVVSDRDKMIKEITKLGSNYRRQVVILQPQITQSQETIARQDTESTNYKRLRQLDTLLHGADLSSHALQATFIVVGDGLN